MERHGARHDKKNISFFYSVLTPVSHTSNTVIYTSVVDGSLIEPLVREQQSKAQTRNKNLLFSEKGVKNHDLK